MNFDNELDLIFRAIESGKCVPFLGAGASFAYTDKNGNACDGLPSGYGLAKELAQKCSYINGVSYDLLKVAEYFVYTCNGDREQLNRTVVEAISIGCTPRPVHTALAQLLPVKVMLTSNYDTLLEDELKHYKRLLNLHYYDPTNPRTGHFEGSIFFKDRDVIVHKMHGSIEHPDSIVITRSDYIRYLANLTDLDRGMPAFFRTTFIPHCTLLFIGYSLEDWNFQVIWEGVLASYERSGVKKYSYAIVKNPDHAAIRYWMSRNVILLDLDITEFAVKLAERFNLEIPQLDIKKKATT